MVPHKCNESQLLSTVRVKSIPTNACIHVDCLYFILFIVKITDWTSYIESYIVLGVTTGAYLSTSITLMVTEALLERFGDKFS